MEYLQNRTTLLRRTLRRSLLGLCVVLIAGTSHADDGHGHHDHGAAPSPGDYQRTQPSVRVPEVMLTNQHGEPVQLTDVVSGDNPLLVQFIFTSCQTVCPILTAMTAQSQKQLKALDDNTRLISISIDPEHDTPRRMREYARARGASGDWLFLTGSREAIQATLSGFGATYEGKNKMYHKPYTFLRDAGGQWTLLRGLMGSDQLVEEYRRVVRGHHG